MMDPQLIQTLRQLLQQALALLGPSSPSTQAPSPSPSPLLETVKTTPNRQLAWGAKVSTTFRDRVWWIADELSKQQGSMFDANWLMACMAFESGESFSASKKNPASSATGLIQFMNQTAADLGTTTAKLAAMSAEDQLNYVFKYFVARIKERGPIRSLEDCYMAILWPSAMGKPSEHPLFVNDLAKTRDSYDVNAGLDANKDRIVTKAEAAAKPHEKLLKGLQPGYIA